MIIYLLHGFNVADTGKNTTDKFVPFLKDKGFCDYKDRNLTENLGQKNFFCELDYGWTGLAGVRLCDNKLAGFLAKTAEPDSIVIGHSNGCAIASIAADKRAPFAGLVFINPAVNRSWRPPAHIGWMDVYYNDRDYATILAAVLPGHRWGAMGHFGPSYNTAYVRDIDTKAVDPESVGHSAVFKRFDYWADRIYDDIVKRSDS